MFNNKIDTLTDSIFFLQISLLLLGRFDKTKINMKTMKNKKLLLYILLLISFTQIIHSQVPTYVPTNGLVGYWPFNGNANDESGNGNNGTVNGATLTADRNGNANSAYYFSGAGCSTRIDASINTSSIQNSFTLAFWLMRSDNGCGSPRIMEFWSGSDSNGTLGFAFHGNSFQPGLDYFTSTTHINNASIGYNQINNNQWSHIVLTCNSSSAKCYQDGVLINTFPSNGNAILSGNAAFGRMNHPANDAFKGKLDDIAIYNRALTQQEITNLYNSCTTAAPTASANQTFCASPAPTLASLSATGTGIQWYDAPTGGNLLASTATLTDDQTVYASQTENSCESTMRTAVTVSVNDSQITASATSILAGTSININVSGVTNRSNAIGNTQNPNPWPFPSAFDAGIISLGQFGTPSVFSTSFWINPESTQNGVSIILDCSHGGSSNWVLQSFGDNNYTWGSLTVSLTPNVWQHVLLTYNNGTKKCFINGQLTSTVNQSISYSGVPNLNLGNWPEGGRRFNGKIDELYVTFNELETTNFTPQQTISTVLPNSMGLWHFDEGTGVNSTNSINSNNLNIGSWYWTNRGQFNTSFLWSNGETSTSINPTPTSTTTYWCDVTVNGATCRKEITITVNNNNPETSAPTANATQSFCAADVPTIASLSATGTDIKWYDTAQNGNLLNSSQTLTNGQTVYASQTINSIESSMRASVTVSVNDPQITASESTICSGTSVELYINQQNNLSPNFSLFHQAGGYFADSNNDDYVVFPVSPTLNTNFSSWTMECWAKIISPGEEGILSIGNQEQGGGNIIGSGWSNTFAAGSNTDAGGSGTISSYPYNVGVWNHFALSFQSGTYRLFLNGELKESWVSGSTVVINNQYPLMTNTHWWWRGRNLSSHRMTVYYDDIRVSKICRYTSDFVPNTNWNNDTNTIGLWDFNEGSGNSALDKSGNQNNGIIYGAIYSSDVPATTISNISLNYSYLWSTGETTASINPSPTATTTYWCDVTTNGVTCRKEVTITVTTVTAPTASAQTFCSSATVANLVATGTAIKWYAASTGGTAFDTNTALVTGTTYYASQTIGDCESSRTAVLVIITPATPPTAEAQTFCNSAAVANLVATGTAIQWYDVANGGTTLASTTALLNDTTYYASQTINGCESTRTSVAVSINDPQITASATTVCTGTAVSLNVNSISSTSNLSPTWELLIPSSQFDGNNLNFSETGYNRNQNLIYSLNGNYSTIFNLNTNTVNTSTLSNAGTTGPFTYDFTNNRLIYGRSGRDNLFAIPANGGSVTQIGNGSFDAESYGGRYFWNPTNQRTGLFGGYGYFAVKNWIWENNGSWTNPYLNNSNCNATNPAKRNGQFALGAPNSNKLYMFSGQGSCDGNQFASSCSLGSPWATDVGVYCWLRDLWELDLQTYTFKNILPVNNSSITKEGNFVYDYITNTFYIIGGYVPSPTYNSNIGNLIDFETNILRYRVGVDSGFLPFTISGTPPPTVKLNNLGAQGTYFDAVNNQLVWMRKDGVWGIKLTQLNQSTYKWSTSETTASINPSPTATTTYWCDITANGVTCRKEITITVNPTTAPTAVANQTFCTAAAVANLIATGTDVKWYATANDVTALAPSTSLTSGTYYASQTINGCESIRTAVTVAVNDAQITASANTVCSGTAVTITASTNSANSAGSNTLPTNLQNGLVGYWPFNGNANDVSGNGNNGTVNGATLTADRFGNSNGAYSFDNLSDVISLTNISPSLNNFSKTISVWLKFPNQYQYSSLAVVKNGTAYSTGFDLAIDQNNSAYGANNYLVVFLAGNGGAITFISNQSELGNWANLIATYNGSEIKLYLNGNLKASQPFSENLNCTDSNIYFGLWDNPSAPDAVSRQLDDIAIYNRALSPQEITQLYTQGQTTYLWSTGETTATINPTPTATTTYWCDITVNGVTCRKEITITIPKITSHPSNANLCATVGASTTISVQDNIPNANYTWQFRVVTATNPSPTWTNISTSNAGSVYSNYTTATLTITKTTTLPAIGTQYRVLVSGDCGISVSNPANITIISTIKAGTIVSAATVCLGGNITLTLGAFTGTSFQWQSAPISTTTAPGVFTDIAGATNPSYTISSATADMNKSYRVVVANSCYGTTAISPIKTIKVDPTSVGGTVKGGGTVCSLGGGTLSLSGNVGKIQWQYSTDGGATYVNAPSATVGSSSSFTTTSATSIAATYVVANVSSNTLFRALVTSGVSSSSASNAVEFVLGTQAVAGTISAQASAICAASGTTLTLSGNLGSIVWQKSTNWTAATPTWTAVTTSVTPTLSTGALSATTAFRAKVTIGLCSTVNTDVTVITVSPTAKGGVVAVNVAGTDVCSGSSKAMKVTGNVGTIQWQMSTTSATAGFVDVAGATTTPYTFTNITQPTWFRVVARSGVCTTTSASNAIGITVSTTPAVAGTISGVNSVCTATGSTLSLAGSTGTIVWQKAIAPFTTWTAIAGATTSSIATGNLTATTAYRAVLTSGSCTAITDAYTVTVSPAARATVISGNALIKTLATAICTSATATLTLATGSIGTIEWQYYYAGSSATSVTNTSVVTWTPIVGATSAVYNASSDQAGNVWFRIKFTSGPCSLNAFSTPINVWFKDCSIAKIETQDELVKTTFAVVAYPNPYSENFNLSLTTSSLDNVTIFVYDMLGKLLDKREVGSKAVSDLQVGDNYPSGVYNVIVTQGENMKTVRVVKR